MKPKIHTELNLGEDGWIKFCVQRVTLICLGKFYSQFIFLLLV